MFFLSETHIIENLLKCIYDRMQVRHVFNSAKVQFRGLELNKEIEGIN